MNGSVVPALIAARIRQYTKAFRTAGATAPGSAIRPADAGLRETFIFHRLVAQRVLVAAGQGRYYLDEARDRVVTRRRRTLVLVLLVIVLALLVTGLIGARLL